MVIGTCRSFDAFEIGDFSKVKREQYDKDMYDEKRRNGELAAAREDGIAEGLAQGHAEGRAEGLAQGHAEGLAEGLAEGREEGRAEGRAEGHAEGHEEANMEVAKKMLAAGMPVEQIVQFTGLEPKVIESLR